MVELTQARGLSATLNAEQRTALRASCASLAQAAVLLDPVAVDVTASRWERAGCEAGGRWEDQRRAVAPAVIVLVRPEVECSGAESGGAVSATGARVFTADRVVGWGEQNCLRLGGRGRPGGRDCGVHHKDVEHHFGDHGCGHAAFIMSAGGPLEWGSGIAAARSVIRLSVLLSALRSTPAKLSAAPSVRTRQPQRSNKSTKAQQSQHGWTAQCRGRKLDLRLRRVWPARATCFPRLHKM